MIKNTTVGQIFVLNETLLKVANLLSHASTELKNLAEKMKRDPS